MKISLKVLKRNLRSVQKLGVNENKWTEYTKELMKEVPTERCMEAGDKYNSVIRTKGVDQACWDMQCGNQLPS